MFARCNILSCGSPGNRFERSLVTTLGERRRLLSSAVPRPENDYGEYEYYEWRQGTRNTKLGSNESSSRFPFIPAATRLKPNLAINIDHHKQIQNDHLPIGFQDMSIVTSNSLSMLSYGKGPQMPITSKLNIIRPNEDVPQGVWPVFRLMDQDGCFRDPALDGSEYVRNRRLPLGNQSQGSDHRDLAALRNLLITRDAWLQSDEILASGLFQLSKRPFADILSSNTLWCVYRQMIRLREMDVLLLNAQRQGRISFYMTCTGEEAIHFGASSALEQGDPVLAQYREQGVLMWRGFTLDQFMNQCFSNDLDLGKGRQMPIHYGSRALNYHTISSPLGTQLPQAVGCAYRLKLMGKQNVAITFFGEGCASTTDFHSAMNFAATLKAPCLFFCRNNGYAISTPSKEQYVGDGIIARAPGYGMAAIRVDGNDVFAVHAAVREARKYALANNAPVLIEAMTYRIGHHSTSDDSSAYRDINEVQSVQGTTDPLNRLENFLKNYDWINDDDIETFKNAERKAILNAFQKAEKRSKPSLEKMFDDVYFDVPPHLIQQKTHMLEHVAKYPEYYKY